MPAPAEAHRFELDRENRPFLVIARCWEEPAPVGSTRAPETIIHVTAHRRDWGALQQEFVLVAAVCGSVARLRDLRGRSVGKGVGTACLQTAEQLFRQHGAREVLGWLSDADYDHRPRQVRFFEKHGYEVTLTGKTGTIRKLLREEV